MFLLVVVATLAFVQVATVMDGDTLCKFLFSRLSTLMRGPRNHDSSCYYSINLSFFASLLSNPGHGQTRRRRKDGFVSHACVEKASWGKNTWGGVSLGRKGIAGAILLIQLKPNFCIKKCLKNDLFHCLAKKTTFSISLSCRKNLGRKALGENS